MGHPWILVAGLPQHLWIPTTTQCLMQSPLDKMLMFVVYNCLCYKQALEIAP
jgi:hypothetical protein